MIDSLDDVLHVLRLARRALSQVPTLQADIDDAINWLATPEDEASDETVLQAIERLQGEVDDLADRSSVSAIAYEVRELRKALQDRRGTHP